MTKRELELRVKDLEQEICRLEQVYDDVASTADVYEVSALRHAALLLELGLTLNKTNYSKLLKENLAESKYLKPVEDNRELEIIREEIVKTFGKINEYTEIFKGEKRGIYGSICQSNSIYGGFVCSVFRISFKKKSAELAYRQNSVPSRDSALECLEMLMKAANEDRYGFSLFYDDEFKAEVPGHCDILFQGEILEMYRAPKGYYSVITFGGMNDREPFGVHTFRERWNTMKDLMWRGYNSLHEARCSMSDVVDEGLAILQECKYWYD